MGKRTPHEQGVSALIVALTVFVLLLIIGGGLSFSLYWVLHERARSIVDAVAITGARALGGSDIGSTDSFRTRGLLRWRETRNRAIELLNAHLEQKTLGFSVEQRLATGDEQSQWELDGMNVSIERGRWLPTEEGGEFESFEGEWQSVNPGVPRIAAANAIRVWLEVPTILPLFDWVPGLQFRLEVAATAIGREIAPVRAAPFAIPVCALTGSDGDIDYTRLCVADRYVTETARYCPPGDPDCNIVPDFERDPILPVSASSVWEDSLNRMGPAGIGTDEACFWATPEYPDGFDNFGVVGLPGTEVPTEEQVQLALMGADGGIPMRVGDPFRVLGAGLTQTSSNEIVWRRIINYYGADPSFHVPYGSSDLRNGPSGIGPMSNLNRNYAFELASAASRDLTCTATNLPVVAPPPGRSKHPVRPGFGTCNSTRSGWGLWEKFNSNPPPGTQCINSYIPPDTLAATYGDVPVWRARAPVIGRRDGEPCSGVEGGSADESLSEGEEYEVLGFVEVVVYDVDIGRDSPDYVKFGSSSDPSPHPCGRSQSRLRWFSGSVTPTFPWGFRRDPASSQSDRCNLIRTRILCDTQFIPTSKSSGAGNPMLVE